MKTLVRVDGDGAMSCSGPGQSGTASDDADTPMMAQGTFPLTARTADKPMVSFGAKQSARRVRRLAVSWHWPGPMDRTARPHPANPAAPLYGSRGWDS